MSTKPPRGVASLDLSPMDRYREVYARVFDLISHRGGAVDRDQAPTGHGFMARRYNQIRAVRASVIVTSTVAAMSTVTAIQNIYNTALDDIARLPRGRLLPLTTLDVRPSDLDNPMRSPGAGGPERYSDYFVAARSVLEAAMNATKILVLFESLCIVNAAVSGKRFIDHRRAGTPRGIEGGVAQRSVSSDGTPDSHVDGSITHDGDLTTEVRKSPKMAVELAITANKYYSSLWKKKKGLDESVSSVFSSGSDLEKESSLGVTTVKGDSAQEEKTQSTPPSFRRRNTVLKKLGMKKDYIKEIHATLDAREKAAEKGKALVTAAQLDGNTNEQPKKAQAVQGLRRRNATFRDDCVKDHDRYTHVKVTGGWGPVVVGAILEEGIYAKPNVESIVRDLRSCRTVTTGDLLDKAIADYYTLSSEDEGRAARFSFDDADICCTEVVVESPSPEKLAKMEEGMLSSLSDSGLAQQDAVRCEDTPTMTVKQPDSVGDSCTINGKQAAIIRPFSVSSGATKNEAAPRQMSFRNLHSRVRDQALTYASGAFVSCYTAVVMHMSLYFSLREKYRNPTARSRYSDLLYDDEVDVINGMPAEDLVSPVVHACRVSLSTTSRNNNIPGNSR